MSARKAKIRIIYAYPDSAYPILPNINYDFDGHIKRIQQVLATGCPDIDMISCSTMLGTAEEGKKILAMDEDIDGYVIYLAGCLWGDLTETIAGSGKPTIIADNLFAGSGEFLTSYAAAKRMGYPVLAVSSSNPQDLVDAVNCFNCLGKLKDSTILIVGGDIDTSIEQIYGTKVLQIPFDEINGIYKNILPKDAEAAAEKWINESEKVIEPPKE